MKKRLKLIKREMRKCMMLKLSTTHPNLNQIWIMRLTMKSSSNNTTLSHLIHHHLSNSSHLNNTTLNHNHLSHHHKPLDFKVLQEQQQQGFKTMTELVADNYEKIKEYQEYQYDQMKTIIAQQQEMIQTQNREVQVMKNRHDQMEKELSEIRQAQVNLALYKTSSRSQIEDGTKEEIQRLKKIIEEQRVALAQQSRAS
ncbi:hypothetical protein PIB30_113625, partial [Stylosanthes scabra]|nr:hypothetical protein [Stylosanthes scabra]